MKVKKVVLSMVLFLMAILLLTACGKIVQAPSQPDQNAMGLLKVTVTGIGDDASPTATAEWVGPQQAGELSSQAATVVNVSGGSALNDVQFIRRAVSVYDNDVASTRFVTATFDLVNRTTTNFDNFTLYAVHKNGVSIGGTGITGMTSGAGAAITNAAIARGFKPTHGMRPSVTSLVVNSDTADLQFFTRQEVSAPTTGIKQQAISRRILTSADTVLEYGFVARNYAGGRTIEGRNTDTNCTVNACKGTVTLAYQLPKVNPRENNPFSFSLYFVVANETVQMGSQSIEEQTPNTVMGLNTFSSFAQLRTLAGSSFGVSDDRLNPLCRVRTAVSPNAFLGPNPLPRAAGSLDACFGVGGKRTTDIDAGSNLIQAVALQGDGKIVAAGYSLIGNGWDFTLTRYNPNGSLDTTFDMDGNVTTDLGSSDDIAYGVAVQGDGKIVVVGESNGDFAVVRYNPNGSLDTSFESDGIVITAIDSGGDSARGVAIQNDGMIVVVGYSVIGFSFYNLAVVRYKPNGSLDPTFDSEGRFEGDGIVTTAIGSSNAYAHSIAIYPDDGSSNANKIVVAGYIETTIGTTPDRDFAVVRYNPNGSLDTSFDTDGVVTTSISSFMDGAFAVTIQSDGKIVAAGLSNNGRNTNTDIAVVRYNTNGSLDTTFDSDGIVTTDFGSHIDQANSVAIQSDNKIVVAGFSGDGSGEDFALGRYNTNGSLDTTFDSDGKVITAIGSSNDTAQGVVIQSDGKIVVAGSSLFGDFRDFTVVRYNP